MAATYDWAMAGPLRRVDIAELRGFCAAVELGSLSRAARLLQISQPALSKRVRALELLTGTSLLERSPRGVHPTAAGAELYEHSLVLLAQAQRVEALIARLSGEQTPVRVAASHTIAEFVLPTALVHYRARRGQHLALELVVANSAVVRELVADGRVDFGIAALDPGAGQPDHLEQVELCEDEVIVALPSRHAWVKRSQISLADLQRTPMVMRDPSANTRRVVEAALRERHMTLAPALVEVGSTAAAIARAISAGVPALLSGLALNASDQGMVARRVRGIRFRRRFVILHAATAALSADATLLIEHLCSYLEQAHNQ
ncbi:MAG: LysR family transcriptional regulator [Solirubrobacteraceae bacterium]